MTSTKFLKLVWAPAVLIGLLFLFCPPPYLERIGVNRDDALLSLFVVYVIAVVFHFVGWRRHELNKTLRDEEENKV